MYCNIYYVVFMFSLRCFFNHKKTDLQTVFWKECSFLFYSQLNASKTTVKTILFVAIEYICKFTQIQMLHDFRELWYDMLFNVYYFVGPKKKDSLKNTQLPLNIQKKFIEFFFLKYNDILGECFFYLTSNQLNLQA